MFRASRAFLQPPKAQVVSKLDADAAKRFVVCNVIPSVATHRDANLEGVRRSLASRWRVDLNEALPYAALSERNFYVRFGRFAVGDAMLPTDVIDVFGQCCRALGLGDVEDPLVARRLLAEAQFFRAEDNLLRHLTKNSLELPEEVHDHVAAHLEVNDPFDRLRSTTQRNVYAIDSASTSEVDDAVGLEVDADGVEWITVYVSDATVHVPFDSQLEALSARRLTTTRYLPEGVFFMLPHKIVEAATLRDDKPCRSFNIRFRIDEGGNVCDYSVGVGWCASLRRITYDAVQDLLASGSRKPMSSSPPWLRKDDIAVIHRLAELGKRRAAKREACNEMSFVQLPQPLVRVDPKTCKVLAVEDEVLCTVDARALVAEMMIAANEACSREAQHQEVTIPFRGTRPLSTVHEAARGFVPPQGVALPGGEETSAKSESFARAIVESMTTLQGVSRAVYHHEPLYHGGLVSRDYCHATSPLRRYPDMLVHHQLKALHGRKNGVNALQLIEEFQMAELCKLASDHNGEAKHLQERTRRFWVLRYLQALMAAPGGTGRLEGIVGFTQYVGMAPEAPRAEAARARFRSDVFIPAVQLVHVVWHDDASLGVGTAVEVEIVKLVPETDVLLLGLRGRGSTDSAAVLERLPVVD